MNLQTVNRRSLLALVHPNIWIAMRKRTKLPALVLSAFVASQAGAQQATKSSGEKIVFDSMTCIGQPFVCNPQAIPAWLFSREGASSMVVINHGSQGLDSRIFEYAEQLNKQGIAALVIDHWTPRGFQDTHTNYAATEKLGGNQLAQAIDTLLAVENIRRSRPQFQRFGSIGESLGGGTAIQLVKTWLYPMIESQAGKLLNRHVKVGKLDAIVGMYGHCGHRSATTDRFVDTPVLLITGELDDETPSKYCEDYIPWMNSRGGMGEIVVLSGVGHSFDAPYPRKRINERHFAKCDFFVNGSQVTLTTTGETLNYTPSNYAALREKCSAVGFHSGYVGDRFVAVPHWTEFFRRHMGK